MPSISAVEPVNSWGGVALTFRAPQSHIGILVDVQKLTHMNVSLRASISAAFHRPVKMKYGDTSIFVDQ